MPGREQGVKTIVSTPHPCFQGAKSLIKVRGRVCCISHFPVAGKNPNNLKEERFIFTHAFQRIQSVVGGLQGRNGMGEGHGRGKLF